MANNEKGMIMATEIKHLSVPFYDSLSVEKIVTWAKENNPGVVDRYFPIQRELEKFPRQVSYSFSKHRFEISDYFSIFAIQSNWSNVCS
jgi:hypothetical protein